MVIGRVTHLASSPRMCRSGLLPRLFDGIIHHCINEQITQGIGRVGHQRGAIHPSQMWETPRQSMRVV